MIKKSFSVISYTMAVLVFSVYVMVEFTPDIYMNSFGRLFLLCGICLFLYAGGFLLSKCNNGNKAMKINLWIFFALYLILLITLTLFDPMWGRNISAESFSLENYKNYFKTSVNFIPFKTVFMYLGDFKEHGLTRNILVNLLGNFVCLMPLALFLPLLFKKQNKPLWFLLTSVLTVSAIETLQCITLSGRMDIDDLILNVFGAMVLFFILKIKPVNRLIRKVFLPLT